MASHISLSLSWSSLRCGSSWNGVTPGTPSMKTVFRRLFCFFRCLLFSATWKICKCGFPCIQSGINNFTSKLHPSSSRFWQASSSSWHLYSKILRENNYLKTYQFAKHMFWIVLFFKSIPGWKFRSSECFRYISISSEELFNVVCLINTWFPARRLKIDCILKALITQKLSDHLSFANSKTAASMLQSSVSTKKEQIMNPVRLKPWVQWMAMI